MTRFGIERKTCVLALASVMASLATPTWASPSSSLWRDAAVEARLGRPAAGRQLASRNHRVLAVDRQGLAALLSSAPSETFGLRRAQGVIVDLPMPRGGFQSFRVEESSIMEPSLAVQFPEIKTYIAQGIDDPSATARLDLTPQGFHAMILSEGETTYIDPYSRTDQDHYVSYLKSDFTKEGAAPFKCEVHGAAHPLQNRQAAQAARASNGTTLRTYRLAMSATGEYTAFHGGTVAGALAAITTTINRNTGIYERELAVRFTLVNAPGAIYTDAATDPFANTSADISINTGVLDGHIGNAAYDIGHVFQNAPGGVGYLGSVCNSTLKGGGVTGTNSPTGDPFDVDYVAHELGHQFGGNHSFNGTASACSTRNAGTASEVGSGSTIQAYAGICGVENLQQNTDDFFHSVSLDEMQAFIVTGDGNGAGGPTCGTQTATGNTPPTVSAGAAYTIPQGTPFALTATGSDANGDTLTYAWEERSLGTASTNAASAQTDDGSRPLFRAFRPVTSPTRLFPKLTDILGTTVPVGSFVNGETLPTTARTMTFHVTARDNRANGGGTNDANTTVTISTGSGPFELTSFGTATTVTGQSSQTVTWNVANTTAAPVSCANVAISYSTDRGVNFSTLLASTPNDGTEGVVIPNTTTSQGRIRVACVGNIFFNISKADLTVTAATNPTPTVSNPTVTGLTATGATLGGDVSSDGGFAVTGRGVVYAATATNSNPEVGGTGVTQEVTTGTTGVFAVAVTGLSTTSYTFKAYATNANGTGYTAASTFTIATVPGAPTIGTATAGNTTVSVTFTAPASTGGSPITGYTATCGAQSTSGSASPIVVTGLTNGTAVTCTVRATNAVGNSAASAASNSVTPTAGGGVTKTVCASGCDFTRIQDAINASAPGGSVLVKSTYDGAGEVFPIQTLAIKGQNPAGTITIAGEIDGSGNPTTKIKIRNVGGLDGIFMSSPGVVSNLRIVPGDGTKPNRVIAAGSGNTCPGAACHMKGGLTVQNVVIDFTIIDGTTTAHFNTGNGVDFVADDVLIDKVTTKGIAGDSIIVDGDNYTIRNSTLDGRDPGNGNAIRSTLAIGFGADKKLGGVDCSGFPTNYVINNNTIVGYKDGIRWCTGKTNTVSNNTITDISGKGIDTSGSQGTQIFGNILQQNTTAATHGIGLSTNAFQTCTGNTVRNNKVLGRAARDMQRGIVVLSCLETTIFQNEVRDFADNDGAIYVAMTAGVATKTTIQGNTVIGGNAAGIVYMGADGGTTAVDQSVIRDNVVNEFKRNGIVVQGIKGVRSGAGAGNVVAYNTVRAANQGSFGDTHGFNLQNLANTAFDRNTALDNKVGYGFFLANAVGVNGNCNTGSTNGAGLFGQVNVTPTYGNANVNCRAALYSHYDFDGDGRSDVTMYRHTTGEWFTKNSSNGADTVILLGAPGSDDIPAPGKYTTAGKTDLAIYRYTTGEWLIRRATDGVTTVIPFGSPLVGDVPMPADYDGDGLTDLAVFRVSTANAEWYIRRSSDGVTQYVAWGCAACADLGVPGDYDGDGKADVAVYRRSTGDWFIRKSTDTSLQQVPYGDVAQGDIPVPGRYTQSSKTDMAVYRSLTGEWFIRRSTDFGTTAVTFGLPSAGDFPVSADFTASGITDIAIYRPTPPTAMFRIRRSTDFGTTIIPYGNPGSQDAPLTAR